MEENQKVSLETMTGVGKRKEIAGREYMILPVNVKDMHYVLGEDRVLIFTEKQIKEEKDISIQLYGLNIVDDKKKESFLYLLNKYVFYCVKDEKVPMTEELLIEHNWSFKEIGEFLYTWAQLSD